MRTLCALAILAVVVAATPASAVPVINEAVLNHTGGDTHEFYELYGDPNTDYSDYWIVEVEGEGASAGLLDDATVNVGTTDANGIWWTGFGGFPGAPENGSLTLLLVTGFTGNVGDDIDTDNDGIIDATFWNSVADCVGFNENVAGDFVYCGTSLDDNLPPSGFLPGGASRIPNGVDTDTAADWARNDFDGAGLPGFAGSLDIPGGEVLNTPGALNEVPEPATIALILLGAAPFVGRRRK